MAVVYPPDRVSTADIVAGLARGLHNHKHDVGVLTSVPHFNPPSEAESSARRHVRPRALFARRIEDGIEVVRCHVPRRHTRPVGRLFDFAVLHVTMTIAALRRFRDAEVAIVVSPPLTMALIAFLLRAIGGPKVIYNVQELWPDVPRDLGVIRNRGILSALGALERWIYRRADVVTTIGHRFSEEVRRRAGPSVRVRTIPNFVDNKWILPRDKANPLSRAWGLADRDVVLYAGNLGLTQDFELLLEGAAHLPMVEFVIVGAGAGREALVKSLTSRGLRNVRLEPYQPAEEVANLYGLADVIVVPLKPGHDRTTTPSKIFSAMAAGKPIVACAASDTDLASEILAAKAGVVVPPGDLSKFVAAVRAVLAGSAPSFDRGAALSQAEERAPGRIVTRYHETLLGVLDGDVQRPDK
jgi:colanic acid biosynthesis glycosyl transferase WcaI